MSQASPNPPLPGVAAMALPDFVLNQFDAASHETKQRQLYRILQTGIRQAVLPAGLRLPPSRSLALALGISRNTVVQVFEQLALEGYLSAGVGRGTFVAELAPRLLSRPDVPAGALVPTRSALLSQRGAQLIGDAGAGSQQWGAFAPGVPEVRLFPAKVWSRLQAGLWRRSTPEQLSYATGPGDWDLRQAVAAHLQRSRGVNCVAEQVVVTSGSQQSLQLVAQLLADPGDTAWLEDPGYWGVRSVFRALGLRLVPVAVDDQGLAPNAAQLAKPPQLMFLTPAHQYPTGALMGHGRRAQLLDYAAANGVWVVEDDYDSEFRYGAQPLPSLQGQDSDGRVIYLGTFSKTLFPAIRVAYLVLPPNLVAGFSRALSELFREGQTMHQAVLARFITEGHYASHIRRMRAVYRSRHDALLAQIQQHFGQRLPVVGSDAGLHLVLGLPDQVDDRAVAQQALREGVVARPLSMYHLRQPARSRGLLLGYGAVDEDLAATAFATLARVLRGALDA